MSNVQPTSLGVAGAVTAAAFGACSSSLEPLIPHWAHNIKGFCCREKYALIIAGFFVGAGGYSIAQWIRWEIIRKLLTYREWMYDHKSWKTKAWGMLLTYLVPKKNKLFAFQKYLPKYPLPKLEDTCKKTLEMVKPLISAEEYKLVVDAMADFQRNEGHKLQKVLEQRYETEENWVSELWDKYVYLAGRKPIPVHSNFSCNGAKNFPVDNKKQSAVAANVAYHFMLYKEKIESGNLATMMIQNVVPICCDRYKYVCSTTRIPQEDIDELKLFPNAKHIVVFRKNLMFKLHLYGVDANERESLLTPLEIQKQIENIMEKAENIEKASSEAIQNPSIFTTADRTKWAKIRKRMLLNKVNAQSLNDVESAAFCLILSENSPANFSEEFQDFLSGSGFDRWFDKSMCFIVNENCTFGYNVEHSTAEATLPGRMFEYTLYYSIFDESGNATHSNLALHDCDTKPCLLKWELDEFCSDIEEVKLDWTKLAGDVDALVFFLDKGKGFIKKLRVSPDGYIQMALQLAFYRLHKETPKTYETATTRLFKYARTETIRPVSEHSVQFAKTFDDPSVPKHDKVGYLKKAILYQNKYKLDAMNGRAVDRHLLGLYLAGKFVGQVPKLFSLRPFCEADRLSTSQSPLRYDPIIKDLTPYNPVGGGFGPQRLDGYGAAYFMEEDEVNVLLTSFKSCPDTGSQKFADALQKAVDDMKSLMESDIEDQKRRPHTNGVSSASSKKQN